MFDAYLDHAELAYDKGFRGCGLLNAAAELPAGHAGRALVRRHKDEVENILRSHLAAFVASTSVDTVTSHLMFILEGSMALAGLAGDGGKLKDARQIALTLVDSL